MEAWLIEERMMKALVQTLREGRHSLVIAHPSGTAKDGNRDGGFLPFDGRGVSDLYRLLHEAPETLRGARLADKVVGKGAAALMALGKAKEVYAEVISEPALHLLQAADIRTTYGKLVPHIINREGTGWCPVEIRCQDCHTPEECLTQISSFLKEMHSKAQ